MDGSGHFYEAEGLVVFHAWDRWCMGKHSDIQERCGGLRPTVVGKSDAEARCPPPAECAGRLGSHYFAQTHTQYDCMARELAGAQNPESKRSLSIRVEVFGVPRDPP